MKPFVRDNLSPALKGRKVLLCITGSIAAFKACDIVRGLRDCGAEVRVVLTESAQKFVTPTTLETLSGNKVYTSLWDDGQGTHHIDAARWADVALIAPATANSIAKLALGLADDLMSTELLAFQGPVLVAPAMNPAMYSHPAVAQNVRTLKERGVKLVGPTVGITACKEEGLGRMLEPDEIIEELAETFYERPNGKSLLLTLGPTRSALDPVRYLTNRSSGAMGAALAWAAARAGYKVTAVCGPCDVQLPRQVRRIDVTTAEQMHEAATQNWPAHDIFIAAAAVLDWDVANPATRKMKKEKGEAPAPEFKRNADILATLAASKKPTQYVLGFAAETDDVLENAKAKLKAKGCDALFANDVSGSTSGFEANENAGWWLTPGKTPTELAQATKSELASLLIEKIRIETKTGTEPQLQAKRRQLTATADW